MTPAATASAICAEVLTERLAQNRQWGQQDHPDMSSLMPTLVRKKYAAEADFWKKENACRVRVGELAWDGILLEEVFEAVCEADPVLLRAELVQVAAVAAAWVEAIDRRTEAAQRAAA